MRKKLISLMVLTPLLVGLLQAQTIPTTTTSLESYDMPGYFMVCTTSAGAVQLVEGGNATPEGQWNIVAGLTGTDTVSFMPTALDNHYMRHRSYIFYCDPAATDSLYLNDASFTPEPGLADPEDPTLVSFRSVNYATMFLQHNANSPIGFALAVVAAGNEGAATFRFPEQHPERATQPVPVDEATDVPRETTLGWTPGAYAASHNVYFGTDFDDVNTAGAGSPLLVSPGQDANAYDPPGRLEFGTTYYWRIDEVNAPPDGTVFKGTVWSFTTEPLYYPVQGIVATASLPTAGGSGGPEVTVNGSGLTDGQHGTGDTTMWSGRGAAGDPVWLQYDFDRVYKLYGIHIWNYNGLYEMWLGFGLKDVTIEYATEPNEWMTLGDYELDRATSMATYAGQVIELDGLPARAIRINVHSNRNLMGELQYGLSEIQFLYKPVFAREPQPADGETGVSINPTLSWRPGREAASHDVYLSPDSNAVAEGTALFDTVATSTYSPPTLIIGTTYFWRIDEVNNAETPISWDSAVWSFTTEGYVVVDGFEDYTDELGEEIFMTWEDGYSDMSNGSQVGHNDPPYAEETIVYGGDQAMPLRYGQNGATTSEATMTLSSVDWTAGGATTLVVNFHGKLGNAAAQLYIKVNNGAPINYPGGTAALAAPLWKPWNIDLATLGNAAKSVQKLTIGVSGSGSGMLYIDDIGLYREAPPLPGPAVDPGTASLMALYAMEDSLADSSGHGYDGTAEVGASYEAGLPGYGKALALDGTSGYATLPIGSLIASLDSITVAAWVNWAGTSAWERIFDFGNDTNVYMFMTPNNGSALRFAITTSSGGGESTLTGDGRLPSGWHHVAVTIDGVTSDMALYFDGRVADSGTAATLPSGLGNTTQNWIGNSQWDDPYFNGSIDDFRIYNRALSDGEVRYLVGDR